MLRILCFLILSIIFLHAKIILDDDNNKVIVPDNVERATPLIGGFVQISAMLGNQSKVISGSPRLPPLMKKIFPQIKNASVSGMLGASVETLIASKTQVVFGPVGMKLDEGAKQQLQKAGIAVVNLYVPGNTAKLKESVDKIAQIFGGQAIEKAREFNAYFDENVHFITKRVAKISPKKRVLVLNLHSGNFSTISARDMGAEYISIAGGINLSSQLNDSGDFKVSKAISEEQVLVFNPDIIITNSNESLKQITKMPSFQGLKAIKNKQIFVNPSGVYLWSVRSAEGALQPLWLAKVFYPNAFKDLNIEQKIKEFYKRFYDYTLSDEELQGILHPER